MLAMTTASPKLLEARDFLKSQDSDLSSAEVGICGGPSHVTTGTSYHLGIDQLKMAKNPYSARTGRDKAGLADPAVANFASALDIDDDLDELRDMSQWIVAQCRAGTPDTSDIREVIYTPDGVSVWTWDREQGAGSAPQRRGDSSHLTHTHVSWYRDAGLRDKASIFRRYFSTGQEADVYPIIEFGEESEDVIKVQFDINKLTDGSFLPSGKFDEPTYQALKSLGVCTRGKVFKGMERSELEWLVAGKAGTPGPKGEDGKDGETPTRVRVQLEADVIEYVV